MREHLKKRDQVREITREVLQTFGSLHPKLEHLATTPLPDKSSIIQIVADLLEVIYPGYFGRKYVEVANIEYHIGDLIDSIYARLTQEIYRSVRPQCEKKQDENCDHCWKVAEEQAILFLRKLPKLRVWLSTDAQAAYENRSGQLFIIAPSFALVGALGMGFGVYYRYLRRPRRNSSNQSLEPTAGRRDAHI